MEERKSVPRYYEGQRVRLNLDLADVNAKAHLVYGYASQCGETGYIVDAAIEPPSSSDVTGWYCEVLVKSGTRVCVPELFLEPAPTRPFVL
jgi:hypothetical protein